MIGGVRIHHAMFGITILFVMTLAWVIGAGWSSMSSTSKLRPILYGIGWALILDELALVLNLADGYWAPLGNGSLIAVAIFVVVVAIASVRSSDKEALLRCAIVGRAVSRAEEQVFRSRVGVRRMRSPAGTPA